MENKQERIMQQRTQSSSLSMIKGNQKEFKLIIPLVLYS